MSRSTLFLDRLATALCNTTIWTIESEIEFKEAEHTPVGKLTLSEYGLSKFLEDLAAEIAEHELVLSTSDQTNVTSNRLFELQVFYEQVEALIHTSILERYNDPEFPQPILEVLSNGTVVRVREQEKDKTDKVRSMH